MRRLSISLLNKIENDVSQRHNWLATEAVQGIWSPLSVLIFQASHPSLRIRLCPTLHRLMTLCWQLPLSGHTGMRFPWSMSLSWNDFHLAPKMLLLDALMRQDLTS